MKYNYFVLNFQIFHCLYNIVNDVKEYQEVNIAKGKLLFIF